MPRRPPRRFSPPPTLPALAARFAVRAALIAALCAAPALAPSARAGTPVLSNFDSPGPVFRAPGFAPDRLLVKFQGGVPRETIRSIMAREQTSLRGEPIGEGLAVVDLPPGSGVLEAAERWSRLPGVEYAVPDLYGRAFFTPNDTTIAEFDLAWSLRSVDAFSAWDVTTGSPDVVVAIIDTGVAFEDHPIPASEREHLAPEAAMYRRSPELSGPFVQGFDFVNEDSHANDDHGHGTLVATVAAGLANNIAGSAGIASGVTLMPIKVLDFRAETTLSTVVRGIRYAADHGADVANLSLGFPPRGLLREFLVPENVLAHIFKPLRDATLYARRKGVILVAGAGNFERGEVSPPAAYPEVISVGATAFDGRRSSYSSFGVGLDFMAPGGDFRDLNEDFILDWVAELGIKPYRSDFSLARPDSFNVFFFFGTSAACPHVTGAVALLRSMGMREQGQIEETLRATAIHPLGQRGGWEAEHGFGLIQIGRAVRAALERGGRNPASGLEPTLDARVLSSNPARGVAAITYRMTRPGVVRAQVIDVRGARVRTWPAERAAAGERNLAWDGRDDRGEPVPNGVYFVRIETSEGAIVRKLAYLR